MKKHDKIELLDEIKRIEDDNCKIMDAMYGAPTEGNKNLQSILEKNDYLLDKLYEMLNEET